MIEFCFKYSACLQKEGFFFDRLQFRMHSRNGRPFKFLNPALKELMTVGGHQA